MSPMSGVDQTQLPTVWFYLPEAFDETIQYIDIELVSGDKFNGVYQATATIPQNSISGTWNSFASRFTDENGIEQVSRAETVTFEVTGS